MSYIKAKLTVRSPKKRNFDSRNFVQAFKTSPDYFPFTIKSTDKKMNNKKLKTGIAKFMA